MQRNNTAPQKIDDCRETSVPSFHKANVWEEVGDFRLKFLSDMYSPTDLQTLDELFEDQETVHSDPLLTLIQGNPRLDAVEFDDGLSPIGT